MRQMNIEALVTATPGANKNGGAILAANLLYISVSAASVGAAIDASIVIETSNDCAPDETQKTNFTPTNWTALGSPLVIAGTTVVASAKIDVCYEWIRCRYVANGAATGSVSVRLKAIGA